MQGAKCTICKVQSLSICWKLIVLQGRMNVQGCCLLCMLSTGCTAEYFTTAAYFYKTSTSAIEFVSRQPKYCRFVSKFWTGMSVHGDDEQEVVSHPFPPVLPLICAASVLPFNPCQCASRYKLYSLSPCIVLNWCLWFGQEIVSRWDSNAWLTCRQTVLPACCPPSAKLGVHI